MAKILGLDLGTNSIGWALVDIEEKKILGVGSKIIPMDAGSLSDFNKGNTKSQTSERTRYRGIRRLIERFLLRRERLHKVLNVLSFLPDHYRNQIDFKKNIGKYLPNCEPKLAWGNDILNRPTFIFQSSYDEMHEEFSRFHPDLLKKNKKIPYDWTIYYLRKKALSCKIKKEELSWILMNFNQKRGYYQMRGEDEVTNLNKKSEFYSLKVVSVEETTEKKGNDTWYNIYLENGWIYRRTSKYPLNWEGKIKDFIVTTDINDDGTEKLDKEGNIKRSFRSPNEDDWTLIKKKTEYDIENSFKTVGWYIYDSLLQNPNQKVRGKLVRTIERKYYKTELELILNKQKEFHPELADKNLYNECLKILYPNNANQQNALSNRDFKFLFINDLILYQRPLKSKKSLISNCPLEKREFTNIETGEIITVPVKCIAKSHPLFQEFRLWQFISNIKIYQKEKTVNEKSCLDVDVTSDFLKTEEDYTEIYEWLNDLKEIDQKTFLKFPKFQLKKEYEKYRWNYLEDKSYPCNETRAAILSKLKNVNNVTPDFLIKEIEIALWHILYSVEDKAEIVKALNTFAGKYNLDESFVENFKKFPPFKKEYGSYSSKAIKKLLPLMRVGKYWDEGSIDSDTRKRIQKIIDGEYDEKIKGRIREKTILLTELKNFKFLPAWLAVYIVYNRNSDVKDVQKWDNPNDIDSYLKTFKQHSLRNPIVEQVIVETLRVVRDIWKKYGDFSEIHIELAREMKNPADIRKKITETISKNENTNIRIKTLLMEFLNPEYSIENVHPLSPSQQEIFKIFEDGILSSNISIPDEIQNILKKFSESDVKKQPSKSDILRYKLWLEQKYHSPYTNQIIPLSKLFTPAYQIEHIIPQARYFDDSFNNKVICETEINALKDKFLGYEFIKKFQNNRVELSFGKTVEILSVEAYESLVKENYKNNRTKLRNLLMEDIPDKFIERQLNDTRYISKVVKTLLSNIVRESDETDPFSKNIITCTGQITDILKKDWGLNDIWNNIVSPRFIRLNELTNSNQFGNFENKGGNVVFQTNIPIELQKGFSKKRIDHRHHAMDAIVIACATRSHVNYLNNESAKSNAKETRFDLRKKLRKIETVSKETIKDGEKIIEKISVAKEFIKPWETFAQDVQKELENTIVSFKQNLRIINKTSNYTQYIDEKGKKKLKKQIVGDCWAIRKPMHKETFYGLINLRRIRTSNLFNSLESYEMLVDKKLKYKIRELKQEGLSNDNIIKYFKRNSDEWSIYNFSKIEFYYFTNETKEKLVASRKSLDKSFNSNFIANKIADTGIQRILLKHLENNSNNPEIAFSDEGIEELNKNIKELNNGKDHKPINKVRVYEPLGNKFSVGTTGSKKEKFVEAEKGTNLFYAIYINDDGVRVYETIPLNIVIERQKQGLYPVPEFDSKGNKLLFYLSPNDLVYLPTPDEIIGEISIDKIDRNRIYKMVSCTDNESHFIPSNCANPIVQTLEFGSNNKAQRAWTNEMIKEICFPLKIDRLGNIVKILN